MLEEKVGARFDAVKLHSAQSRTWALLRLIAKEIRPGMTEADATEVYRRLLLESGADKEWHPAKIRFGVNSLRAFREPSEPNIVLRNDAVFFLDIGPIFDGYEGDCGQTFVIGNCLEGKRVIDAGERIFNAVATEFKAQRRSGSDLYRFAEQLAAEHGYELVDEGARGHRVSDFPHAVHYRGPLKQLGHAPAPDRWILEIQLRDLKNNVGSFYEDLLS